MATLIRLPLLALFSFFLVAINNGNAFAQNAKKKIEVLFTTKMKKADLMKIKAEMLKKHIQIDYREARYDASGYLTYLDFNVDCRDGFKGGAGTNMTSATKRFGFFRDYSKDASAPFVVGFL
jgi:hypothetical protein